MSELKPLLKIDEAAAYLGVAPKTMRKIARDFGGLKVGNQWRFNRDRFVAIANGEECSNEEKTEAAPTMVSGTSRVVEFKNLLERRLDRKP